MTDLNTGNREVENPKMDMKNSDIDTGMEIENQKIP
jgi:hypothetical protein